MRARLRVKVIMMGRGKKDAGRRSGLASIQFQRSAATGSSGPLESGPLETTEHGLVTQ
jgi:hypothetical protein